MDIKITEDGQNTRIWGGADIYIYKKRVGWSVFCPALKTLGYSENSPLEAVKDFMANLELFFRVQLHFDRMHSTLTGMGHEPTPDGYRLSEITFGLGDEEKINFDFTFYRDEHL